MEPIIKEVGIKNVTFGKNVMVVKPVNIYDCSIGDDCRIGPFVEIQSDVKIGNRTKVQSHAFICTWVEIGDDCFISHGVKFVNDTFIKNGPARGDKNFWRKTKIGNRVSIGTNATILPVEIKDGIVVGAGAVVTKDLDEPGVYAGNPARKIKDLKREYL